MVVGLPRHNSLLLLHNLTTNSQAYAITEDFMVEAGCSFPLNASAELECMRSLDWETLISLTKSLGDMNSVEIVMCESVPWSAYFHHVIDGTTVPYQVIDAYKENQFNDGEQQL